MNGYGDKEIELLSSFYGSEASVEYEGIEYTSPVLNTDDLISEWKVYRRAMLQEKDMMAANGDSPTMQELSARMMSCQASPVRRSFPRFSSSFKSFYAFQWALLRLNGVLAK